MPGEPASSAHPSALETFYDSWVNRPERSIADRRAERRARLMPIMPCVHDAPLHYDDDGHGPFCTHCGDIVYHHEVAHHAAPVTFWGTPWDMVCTAIVWLMKPVARQELVRELYDLAWLVMIASYVGLGTGGILGMALKPVTWLDFVVFQVNYMFITAAATVLLMRWAQLLPRRLLTWS